MRNVGLFIALFVSTSIVFASSDQFANTELHDKRWIHGSEDCAVNTDPPIEIFQFDTSSYILRQNKCLSFEAPFVYVLFGETKVLVLDTGATDDPADYPLYETVISLLEKHSKQDSNQAKTILVLHSHSHGDHHAGDSQFEGKPNVTIIKPNHVAVTELFGSSEASNEQIQVYLGARALTIFPTPGHQEEAITIYDPQTKWLITGDTLYPGYIYVKNWKTYKKSITRMATFARNHEISAVLGAHIEMTLNLGKHYPIGALFQPNEASLVLPVEDLFALDAKLQNTKKSKIVFDRFVIAPMSAFQKMLSRAAKALVN